MITWNALIVPLIILVDILAIIDVFKRKNYSMDLKLLWMVIIIMLPLLGVSLYYFMKSRTRKSKRR